MESSRYVWNKVKGTSDNNNKNWATASENRPTISLTRLKQFAKICYNLIIQCQKGGSWYKKVQVGNDQEKEQSERNSDPNETEAGKNQIDN